MTNIEFFQFGDIRTLTITGHAGYNPGNDIVCAAASMLACTLMAVLESEKEAGNLKYLYMRHTDGDVFVRYEAYENSRERIMVVTDTVLAGYRLLAQSYPENIFFKR